MPKCQKVLKFLEGDTWKRTNEQHFTERELAGSHAFAMRWDQLFPFAIFEDLCKISDTAKQGDDRRVHEGGILSVGFDLKLMHFVQVVLNFDKMSRQINHDLQDFDGV